jgi:hypothetical protein
MSNRAYVEDQSDAVNPPFQIRAGLFASAYHARYLIIASRLSQGENSNLFLKNACFHKNTKNDEKKTGLLFHRNSLGFQCTNTSAK